MREGSKEPKSLITFWGTCQLYSSIFCEIILFNIAFWPFSSCDGHKTICWFFSHLSFRFAWAIIVLKWFWFRISEGVSFLPKMLFYEFCVKNRTLAIDHLYGVCDIRCILMLMCHQTQHYVVSGSAVCFQRILFFTFWLFFLLWNVILTWYNRRSSFFAVVTKIPNTESIFCTHLPTATNDQ